MADVPRSAYFNLRTITIFGPSSSYVTFCADEAEAAYRKGGADMGKEIAEARQQILEGKALLEQMREKVCACLICICLVVCLMQDIFGIATAKEGELDVENLRRKGVQ